MIVVVEAIQPLAVDFPDEQAAAGLETPDIARGVGIAPAIPAGRWLVAEFGPFVHGQPVVRAGKRPTIVAIQFLVVRVEIEIAGRLLALPGRVAGTAAPLQDRLDVPVVLHVVWPLFEDT